jgi:ABC-2 type transport system permease protein
MMIPLLTITVFMRYPNGVLATGLSLFPLTTPVTMLTRLATVDVPPWQVILSLSLIIMTTFLILRLVARLFRAQVLLSGQQFNIQRLIPPWAQDLGDPVLCLRESYFNKVFSLNH